MNMRHHKRRLAARQFFALQDWPCSVLLTLSRRGKPIPIHNALRWALKLQALGARRHIGEDFIDGYRVSTVFLGTDNGLWPGSGPLCFETMIFAPDGEPTDDQVRYNTGREAVEGHARAVALLRKKLAPPGGVDA